VAGQGMKAFQNFSVLLDQHLEHKLSPNNDYGTIANYQSLKWMTKQVFAQVSKFCMGNSTHKRLP